MPTAEISADEFVKYAIFLFGEQWRNALSAKLGISRKSLVITLASGEKIPNDMTFAMLGFIDQRLDQMRDEQALLRDRIRILRDSTIENTILPAKPQKYYRYAC